MRKDEYDCVCDAVGKAMSLFSPNKLIIAENLVNIDGVACVNREKVIDGIVEEAAFYVVMEMDYGWDYSDIDDSTIYFENGDDGNVYGGIYDTKAKKKKTRRLILSGDGDPKTHYTYGDKDVKKLARIVS